MHVGRLAGVRMTPATRFPLSTPLSRAVLLKHVGSITPALRFKRTMLPVYVRMSLYPLSTDLRAFQVKILVTTYRHEVKDIIKALVDKVIEFVDATMPGG